MTEKTEDKPKKPFKTCPGFYQDILGSLLVAYATTAEEMRFIIARDICGYVPALLRYTRAYDMITDSNPETTFGDMSAKATDAVNDAITYYKAGDTSTALIMLGTAMDSLKQIIITREMIAEGYEIRSRPFASSSLADDTESNNYRRVG